MVMIVIARVFDHFARCWTLCKVLYMHDFCKVGTTLGMCNMRE